MILAGGLAALVAALVAVVYTWRKDLKAAQIVSEDKLLYEARAQHYERESAEWKVRYIAKDRELQEHAAKAFNSDQKLARDAIPSSVIDTVRERLRAPLASETPNDRPTPPVFTSDVTPSLRNKPRSK